MLHDLFLLLLDYAFELLSHVHGQIILGALSSLNLEGLLNWWGWFRGNYCLNALFFFFLNHVDEETLHVIILVQFIGFLLFLLVDFLLNNLLLEDAIDIWVITVLQVRSYFIDSCRQVLINFHFFNDCLLLLLLFEHLFKDVFFNRIAMVLSILSVIFALIDTSLLFLGKHHSHLLFILNLTTKEVTRFFLWVKINPLGFCVIFFIFNTSSRVRRLSMFVGLISPLSDWGTISLLHLTEILMMVHIVSAGAFVGISGILRRSWSGTEHFTNDGQVVSLEKAGVDFSHWLEYTQKLVLIKYSPLMSHLLFDWLLLFFLFGILIWWWLYFFSGLLTDRPTYDLCCQCRWLNGLCRSNCSKSTGRAE